MADKIKMDVDRLILLLTMEKKFRYILLKLIIFSISKPKVVYLRPFLSSTISQIKKKKILCTLEANM